MLGVDATERVYPANYQSSGAVVDLVYDHRVGHAQASGAYNVSAPTYDIGRNVGNRLRFDHIEVNSVRRQWSRVHAQVSWSGIRCCCFEDHRQDVSINVRSGYSLGLSNL